MNELLDKDRVSTLIKNIAVILGVSTAVDFSARIITVWITHAIDSTIIMNSAFIKALQELGYVINIIVR